MKTSRKGLHILRHMLPELRALEEGSLYADFLQPGRDRRKDKTMTDNTKCKDCGSSLHNSDCPALKIPLPCPYCGEAPHVYVNNRSTYVECVKCLARGPAIAIGLGQEGAGTRDVALQKWNDIAFDLRLMKERVWSKYAIESDESLEELVDRLANAAATRTRELEEQRACVSATTALKTAENKLAARDAYAETWDRELVEAQRAARNAAHDHAAAVAKLVKAESQRDVEWVQAMAEALGSDSGHTIPIKPDAAVFRGLFEKIETTQLIRASNELNDIRRMLAETTTPDEAERLSIPGEVAASVSALLSHDLERAKQVKGLRDSLNEAEAKLAEAKRESSHNYAAAVKTGNTMVKATSTLRDSLDTAEKEVARVRDLINIDVHNWGSYSYQMQTTATLRKEWRAFAYDALNIIESALHESGRRAHAAFHPDAAKDSTGSGQERGDHHERCAEVPAASCGEGDATGAAHTPAPEPGRGSDSVTLTLPLAEAVKLGLSTWLRDRGYEFATQGFKGGDADAQSMHGRAKLADREVAAPADSTSATGAVAPEPGQFTPNQRDVGAAFAANIPLACFSRDPQAKPKVLTSLQGEDLADVLKKIPQLDEEAKAAIRERAEALRKLSEPRGGLRPEPWERPSPSGLNRAEVEAMISAAEERFFERVAGAAESVPDREHKWQYANDWDWLANELRKGTK